MTAKVKKSEPAKTALITGANKGIGFAIASQLAEKNYRVFLTARKARAGKEAAERIGGETSFIQLDVTDEVSIKAAANAFGARHDSLDVLINNAGSGHFDPGATLPEEVLQEQFQILVFAQIALCQLALTAMEKRGSGLIINISSMAARLPVPFMSAYNAAKAAMASFTMTLQLELRGSNIRVIDIQPADIRTRFNDAVVKPETHDRVAGQVWKQIDANLHAAPPPELVARRISRLIGQANPPPRVTVGGSFQAVVAPLIFKLLPQRVRLWGLQKYYRL